MGATHLLSHTRTRALFVAASLLAMSVVGLGCDGSPAQAAYATRVRFKTGAPIRFPDFVLEFAGERREAPPQYPRGMLFYDFRVTSGSESVTASWSAGTGDIGPTSFTVAGKTYLLELKRSDKVGTLRQNELVVSAIQ